MITALMLDIRADSVAAISMQPKLYCEIRATL